MENKTSSGTPCDFVYPLSMSSRSVLSLQETRVFAESLLYEWWFAVAETLFERVCEVTELDEEQREALRQVALRPNDFQVASYTR